MSSDLDLPPLEIIAIYLNRCKIEGMFLVLKHLLGAFSYRFWSKAMPQRGATTEPTVTPDTKEKLRQSVEACERYVNLAAIALALIQYLALKRPAEIWKNTPAG
jgi:hypothetical protein